MFGIMNAVIRTASRADRCKEDRIKAEWHAQWQRKEDRRLRLEDRERRLAMSERVR